MNPSLLGKDSNHTGGSCLSYGSVSTLPRLQTTALLLVARVMSSPEESLSSLLSPSGHTFCGVAVHLEMCDAPREERGCSCGWGRIFDLSLISGALLDTEVKNGMSSRPLFV